CNPPHPEYSSCSTDWGTSKQEETRPEVQVSRETVPARDHILSNRLKTNQLKDEIIDDPLLRTKDHLKFPEHQPVRFEFEYGHQKILVGAGRSRNNWPRRKYDDVRIFRDLDVSHKVTFLIQATETFKEGMSHFVAQPSPALPPWCRSRRDIVNLKPSLMSLVNTYTASAKRISTRETQKPGGYFAKDTDLGCVNLPRVPTVLVAASTANAVPAPAATPAPEGRILVFTLVECINAAEPGVQFKTIDLEKGVCKPISPAFTAFKAAVDYPCPAGKKPSVTAFSGDDCTGGRAVIDTFTADGGAGAACENILLDTSGTGLPKAGGEAHDSIALAELRSKGWIYARNGPVPIATSRWIHSRK
ncbi:uncharacterized protein KY384_002333, partial [Bacidia gigantensis]|uniref:uncharacterized protein n=1 Tax=Bacidia gigantensis TaxID=2732470 RepID=UPI001D04C017